MQCFNYLLRIYHKQYFCNVSTICLEFTINNIFAVFQLFALNSGFQAMAFFFAICCAKFHAKFFFCAIAHVAHDNSQCRLRNIMLWNQEQYCAKTTFLLRSFALFVFHNLQWRFRSFCEKKIRFSSVINIKIRYNFIY